MKENKNILIIGISSDIGLALVRKIMHHYTVIIGQYRTYTDELCELQKECGEKLVLLQADLSKDEDLEKLITQVKCKSIDIDHVVHLASLKARNMQFRKESWGIVNQNLDVSVKSIYKLLGVLLPGMVHRKYGKVVFMLSSYVIGVPPKFQSSYIVSKYALLGLMNSLAIEYIDYGITFNGVSPDMIETKFLRELPHWIAEQTAQTSIRKRNLTVEDVIPIFEFLLSDQSDNISGQNIEIRNRQ